MNVIELPKRKPFKVVPEVTTEASVEDIPHPLDFFEHLPEPPTTSDLFKQNIGTVHFLSLALTQLLNTATLDLQSKQLLTAATGIAQGMHETNRLSFTPPEAPRDEPERA